MVLGITSPRIIIKLRHLYVIAAQAGIQGKLCYGAPKIFPMQERENKVCGSIRVDLLERIYRREKAGIAQGIIISIY